MDAIAACAAIGYGKAWDYGPRNRVAAAAVGMILMSGMMRRR